MLQADYEPAQKLPSDTAEWSCGIVITTTPLGLRRHGYSFNKFKLNRCIQVHQLSKTWWTQLSCAWIYKVFLKFRDLTSIELSVSDQVVWNLTATQKVVVVQSYTIQKMKKSLMKNSVFCAVLMIRVIPDLELNYF